MDVCTRTMLLCVVAAAIAQGAWAGVESDVLFHAGFEDTLAADVAQGAAEPAGSESPPAIEATASPGSTSANSRSGTIMITMTGMAGDPGDLSGNTSWGSESR